MSAIVALIAAYAVTSFLHGSPWYWIRTGSLTLLIAIAAGALLISPSPRPPAKKDPTER